MANSETLIPIPGRLHSVATEGHVAGADEIFDDNYGDNGALQSTINATVDAEIGDDSTDGTIKGRIKDLEDAVGTGGSVDSRIAAAKSEIKGNATSACDTLGEAEALISAEASRAQAAEGALQQLYENLTQSDIVVVADHTQVATPDANVIYREQGTTSYSDWMYYNNAWKKMAEYDNAIDDVPTAGSDNLVKSGGVESEFNELVPLWLKGQYNPYGKINPDIANTKHTNLIPAIYNDVISIKDNAVNLYRVNMFDSAFQSLGQGGFMGGATFTVNEQNCAYVGITLFTTAHDEMFIPTVNGEEVTMDVIVTPQLMEIDKTLQLHDKTLQFHDGCLFEGAEVNVAILADTAWNGNTGNQSSLSGYYASEKTRYYPQITELLSDKTIRQILFWNGSTYLGYTTDMASAPDGADTFAVNFYANQATYFKYKLFGLGEVVAEVNKEVVEVKKEKQEKRQFIFVNEPSTDLLKAVNDAIIELYVPSYDAGNTYLTSVRRKQDVGGTIYTTVGVTIFDNEDNATLYQFVATGSTYDFGDGVQLLTLTHQSGKAYILINWNKLADGTGYGVRERDTSYLIHECANIDRCPIIKAAITMSPDVVTKEYLEGVLTDYLQKTYADSDYAQKNTTEALLATHTSQISDAVQDIDAIEGNISTINQVLSSLTSPLPSGAITGDNVWTGSNQFAQRVKGVPAQADDELVTFSQIKNTLHRTVDAADYGADPSASATVNATAINSALSGGNKTVAITKPGIYMLDSTLLVYDNTELICNEGVVLKKGGAYRNMIRNAGAETRSQNSNISLVGVNLDCNGRGNGSSTVSSVLHGLVGQLALFHVDGVRVFNLKIRNTVTHALQLCTFSNVVIDGFDIVSNYDGVHINRGYNLVCRNGIVESNDDSLPLNASDWIGSCPEVGSIHDCVFENIVENQPQASIGNFARHLVGKWVDWYDGMDIVNGDKVVSNGHVYRAFSNFSPDHYTSHTQPNCDAETCTQQDSGGFTWVYTNDDAVYEADVYNISYRNILSKANRRFIMSYYESGDVWQSEKIWDRSVYPTVATADYPYAKNISLDNIAKSQGAVLSTKIYMKYRYVFRNLHVGNEQIINAASSPFGYITLDDCDFTAAPSVVFYGTEIGVKGCIGILNITTTGKLVSDSNVGSLPNVNIKGSVVKYDDEIYYNNGSSWAKIS